jgi:hypothetical protein
MGHTAAPAQAVEVHYMIKELHGGN